MTVYGAMQQHLVFLLALALSLPSLGLYCAIHAPFSDLANTGEQRGEETIGKGTATRAVSMRHPWSNLCLNGDLHSGETGTHKAAGAPHPCCATSTGDAAAVARAASSSAATLIPIPDRSRDCRWMQSTEQRWLREWQQLHVSGERRDRLEQSFVSGLTNPTATRRQCEAVLLARPACRAKAGQNVTLIVLPLLPLSVSSRGAALGEDAVWHPRGSKTSALRLSREAPPVPTRRGCALTRCFTLAPHEALSALQLRSRLSISPALPEVQRGAHTPCEEPTLRCPAVPLL